MLKNDNSAKKSNKNIIFFLNSKAEQSGASAFKDPSNNPII